jgi:hypothetical protein
MTSAASDSSNPAYIGRTESVEIARHISDIASHLLEGDAEFMIGAGMSVEAGAPGGLKLAKVLIKAFFPNTEEDAPGDDAIDELAQAFPLEAVAEAAEIRLLGGRDELASLLKSIYLDDSLAPTTAHKLFHAIALWGGEPRLSRIFTTNFDSLLLQVMGHSAVAVNENNPGEARAAPARGQIPLLYLHGSLDHEFQLTESDIFKNRLRGLHATFQAALIEAGVFVFVGYSMSDPDFRGIYMRYRDELSLRRERGDSTFVVSPSRSEYHYLLGKDIWGARRARWIPLDATDFFSRLKRALDERGRSHMRDAIMARRGLKDLASYEDLVERTAQALALSREEAVDFLFAAKDKTGGAG